MRLLLDTHFALWLALDEGRLTSSERATVDAEDVEIFCSSVSLWELRLKWSSTATNLPSKASPFSVVNFGQGMAWTFLPLLPAHAVTPLAMPIPHKDPFDELLLVQAQVEGLRLLTRDTRLRGHPLTMD